MLRGTCPRRTYDVWPNKVRPRHVTVLRSHGQSKETGCQERRDGAFAVRMAVAVDLAIGNGFDSGQPRRLYRNDDGHLTASAFGHRLKQTTPRAWRGATTTATATWTSPSATTVSPTGCTATTAAVLTTSAVWSSVEADTTYSVAWGDYDGDGDLDLAVGN